MFHQNVFSLPVQLAIAYDQTQNWVDMNFFKRIFLNKAKRNELNLGLIIDQMPKAATAVERGDVLRQLMIWLRQPLTFALEQTNIQIQSERFIFFTHYLFANEAKRQVCQDFFTLIVQDSDYLDLFYIVGLEEQQGFLRELVHRTVGLLIPKYSDQASIRYFFEILFTDPNDVEALLKLDSEKRNQLSEALIPSKAITETVRTKVLFATQQAAILLSSRLSGMIVDPDLFSRLPHQNSVELPFMKLQRYLYDQFDGSPSNDPLTSTSHEKLNQLLHECTQTIQMVYPLLEHKGVSIDLVYKLEVIQAIVRRLTLLLGLFAKLKTHTLTRDEWTEKLLHLAQLHAKQQKLTHFLGKNLNLLAKKIVERNSLTGEHYIAHTKEEFQVMFWSAGGGGFITSFTTLFKIFISKANLPLFVEGVFSGVNYAASFIFIQFSHFTLATKTPAVTATTLATHLIHLSDHKNADAFVREVIAIHRTAFIAVVGNLGLVVPGCIIVDLFWYYVFGHHILNVPAGMKELHKLNPLTSLTVIYAIFTGGLLWAASIAGAWFENWCVFRNQFDVLAQSTRLQKWLGPTLWPPFVPFVIRNTAGVSTNIALGFMLSFFGIFGQFFGLPMEVRHVTLSTGAFTYGMLGAYQSVTPWAVVGALFGIFLIGLLNFGVSFTLSLFVAARARNIRLREFPGLIQLILTRYRQNPKSFYWV